MVSLRDILPFSTKVCVMKRVRSDGSVELYCERPTKANASRDECIECLPVEDCQEIYGLDPTPIFATPKREYYTVDGQLYSRTVPEPARSSQSSNGSSNSRHRNYDSRHSQHSRSTTPVSRPVNHVTDNSTRISNAGNPQHTERHSSRLSNNGFIMNGNGNTTNLHNNRTNLNYSGNATSSYREDRRYNTHFASQDRYSSPDLEPRTSNYSHPRERSDFSAAEQAAWEERQWRKLQEEEYARDRSPSPCYDYKDHRDVRGNREERSRSRRREDSRGRSPTVYYDCEDDCDERDERSRPRRREHSRGRTCSAYYEYDNNRDNRDEREERPRSSFRERSRRERSCAGSRAGCPSYDYDDNRSDRDGSEERPRSRLRHRSDFIEVLDARFIYAGSGEFQGGDWIYTDQRECSGDVGFVYIGEGGYDSDGRDYSL
ncbi:hypothetical protein CKAH01_04799 [Colletotrichum kahawae]|uniref:Uncharacterized protein n=1 Tax=Colletotrichum kahawae TaxID=34407 RepID=A0AAD9YFL8_COLKA|nr:hypothetical protein CKAH01_04799 [Colletotrichum kahawae]